MMASNQETKDNANKDLSSLIQSVIKPLLESTLKSQKKEITETFDKKVKTILDGQKEVRNEVTVLKEYVSSNVTRIDKELEGIVQSQSFISKQYEKQKTTCESLIKKVTKQGNEISDLNNQLKQVKKQLKSTQRDVNDQNQYGRREMLEVNGIPRLKEENITTLILQMADKCKVPLTEDDMSQNIYQRHSTNYFQIQA